MIHIKVAANGDQRTEDKKMGTQDGKRSLAVVSPSDLRTISPSDVPPSPPSSVVRPPGPVADRAQTRVGALPAADDLFTGVTEDLMIFFLAPWVLGLYCRLRYLADRVERVLVLALMGVSVALGFPR